MFNTWAGAFFNPGGGEVQLRMTLDHLRRAGFQISLYDQWSPQRDFDIFHQFSIQYGVEYPMVEYRNIGKKIALSTILWAEYPKDSEAYRYLHHVLNLADILFTNSNAESAKISRAFDVEISKFHRTVNGVSEEFLDTRTSADFRQRFSIDGDFILTVANVDRRKNTHALVDACRRIGKPLVSIGHVRDPEYFAGFGNSSSGFRHVGPISDISLLKSAYQQASVFALPSLCETPGLAALEAASQGCRIAVTTEGSAGEYFGDHATYVSPFDIDDISRGIDSELGRPRDKQALIDHIRTRYTWSHASREVAAGYAKLYR